MRSTVIAALALMAAATAATAATTSSSAAGTLTITVSGAEEAGQVRAMLFADADSFARSSGGVAAFTAMPTGGRAAVSFHDLPPGRYAIAAFLDRNGNETLDTGLFGLPSEPYGLANGAVDFEQARVMVGTGDVAVSIRLR